MKPTPYNIYKGIRYLKNYGWKEFVIRLKEKSEPEDIAYQDWYLAHRVAEEELSRQKKESAKWKQAPKISILVPAYKTPEEYLRQMIASVQEQSYANWELCIADATESEDGVKEIVESFAKEDDRIVYRHLEKNEGIAGNTNQAFKMATGAYIALLDHDDLLAPDALYEAAKAICFPEKVKQFNSIELCKLS